MSEADVSSGHRDCGQDVGAYVLGALEPEAAERFRRHMAECVVCRDELATLQSVVDALGMAAPQLPVPPALRRRVVSSVHAGGQAAAGGRLRRPLGRARAAPARGLVLALAALAAAAVAVAAVTLSAGGSGTRTVRASVTVPSASAVIRLTAGHGELVVRRMPAAPVGEIYEVWLKRSGAPPTPTNALFDVTSAGAAAVAVPGNLRGVGEVLVTAEPRGGTAVPTHAPVILARIS